MTTAPRLRAATSGDIDQLVSLWGLLFDDAVHSSSDWRSNARAWFSAVVQNHTAACLPVIEVDEQVIACAVGTLELGVPNPQCRRGRTVRLANVITRPDHRGHGYGTALVERVVDWARSIDADRVDLSATPDGQRIYERVGFVRTSAPRLKLML